MAATHHANQNRPVSVLSTPHSSTAFNAWIHTFTA